MTKKRNFCEKPRVFSAKVAQIMDFLACGGQRRPGGAKWCRLGADLPVKMLVKSMLPSNFLRKIDKLMLLWRKSLCFLSKSCSNHGFPGLGWPAPARRSSLAFSGALCRSLALSDALWRSLTLSGALWRSLALSRGLWLPLACFLLLASSGLLPLACFLLLA